MWGGQAEFLEKLHKAKYLFLLKFSKIKINLVIINNKYHPCFMG